MLTTEEKVARFWKRVNQRGLDDCWFPVEDGDRRMLVYWSYQREPKRPIYKIGAHVALFSVTGEWPVYVEHTCDEARCLNPAHLVESDHPANMASMVERGRHPNQAKTHCPKGHPYEVYARIGTRGNGKQFRICKACEREAAWTKRGPAGKRGPKRLASATSETDLRLNPV